mmetsp:Transcript_21190/g.60788  ORF Transcript_21190/g.60788 Transcript_21190/m.60788 type:complete len:267 (+) Transcript_21190:62-862(+)
MPKCGVDLKAALLPPPDPVDRYNMLLSLYHCLAQAVGMVLLARIKPTKAPNSHAAMSSIACQDAFGPNGFKMLEELLKLNVVANGALNEDDFDHRLRVCQPPIGTSRLGVESDLMAVVTEAASNGCSVLPNSLLKHFLRVLHPRPPPSPPPEPAAPPTAPRSDGPARRSASADCGSADLATPPNGPPWPSAVGWVPIHTRPLWTRRRRRRPPRRSAGGGCCCHHCQCCCCRCGCGWQHRRAEGGGEADSGADLRQRGFTDGHWARW